MQTIQVDKHKNKVFNLGIVVLALMVAGGIYQRQKNEIKLLKKTQDTEIKKNAVLADIGKIEKTLTAYKHILPRKDANRIIDSITDIAKQAGVKIISVRPAQERREKDYTQIPFDLVVRAGSYHTLGKFISKLESYQDVYMVNTIDINSETQTKELRANLNLISIVFE